MIKLFFKQTCLIVVILILSFRIYAQKDPWVSYRIQRPTQYYKIGLADSVLLFAEDSSNVIKIFNLKNALWKTYSIPTENVWSYSGPKAEGNIAMIHNDSLIIACSSTKDTLAYTLYDGIPYSSFEFYGANQNMAWFYTDKDLYIYDGSDGTWRSHPNVAGDSLFDFQVYARNNYLVIETRTGYSYSKYISLMIYNHLTRKFYEIKDWGLTVDYLEDGFVFVRTVPGGPCYFGGYSVYTDLVEEKESTSVPEIAEHSKFVGSKPRYSDLVTDNENLLPDFYRWHLYGFDTRIGHFTHDSCDYLTAGADITNGPANAFTGNSYAAVTLNTYDHGIRIATDIILYNGLTGLFSPPRRLNLDGQTPFPYFISTINGILGYGRSSAIGIDPFNNLVDSLNTKPDLFASGLYMETYAGDNYIVNTLHSTDSLFVIYYNQVFNKIYKSTYEIKGYIICFNGSDYFAILDQEMDQTINSLRYYSVLTDTWKESIYAGNKTAPPYNYSDYMVLFLSEQKKTIIYESVTGEEIVMDAISNYSYAGAERTFVIASPDNILNGYSRINNNQATLSFPSAMPVGTDKVILVNATSKICIYDADSNAFFLKDLSPENDYVRFSGINGNLACVYTGKGWIHVYAPNNCNQNNTSIHWFERSEFIGKDNVSYYPNPCEDYLILDFNLQSQGSVQISIFGIDGVKIMQFEDKITPDCLQEKVIDTKSLKPGIYLLNIMTASGSKTFRIVRR